MLLVTSMEDEPSSNIDPNVFADSSTGYILFRLFGLTESVVYKVVDGLAKDTQKALQASCRSLRKYMNTRVQELKLTGDEISSHLVGELLDRFPAVQRLKLDHISWASISSLTRHSPCLLHAVRVIDISGWKQRENAIEVEHALANLLSHTPSLATLSLSQVKVGVHCLPKPVLASLTSLTELRLDGSSVDCQFAFNAICLLTRLQRVHLPMTGSSCSLKSITNLAQLQHLHLECQAISPADMLRIAQLPHLTTLSLEAQLPDAIPPATWAPHPPPLTHLTLRHGSIHNCEVLGLSKLTTLKKLVLETVEFSTADLPHLTALTKLEVSGPQHNPYSLNGILQSVAPAGACLRTVGLHHAGTLPADAELAFAPFGALTRLVLRVEGAESAGCAGAQQLQQLTALRSLEVLEYDGDLDSDIVRLLGALPALREIQTTGAFSISCELDVCLPALTSLRAQDLRDTGVGLRALGFLAPHLRHLDVLESSVDSHSLTAVGCGCCHLTRLKLFYTTADDAAVTAIGRGCPLLQHLALYASDASPKALTALAEGCPLLTHLKLFEVNKITDANLITLARSCPSLIKLYLVDAPVVTDAGVVALMLLRDLERVFIKGAKGVTAVGMTALATCPRLREVKVIYCGINKEDTRDLFQRQGVKITV